MKAFIIKILNRIFNFFKRLSNKTDKQCKTLVGERLNSELKSNVFINKEILENNDFKLLASYNGIYMYSGINGRMMIHNSHYFDGWDWHLDYDNKTGTATSFGRIHYVHELQQVLKNNHIDTQIKV